MGSCFRKCRKINSQTQCKAQLFDLNDHETLRKEINESIIFTNATNVGMGKLEGKNGFTRYFLFKKKI